MKRILSLFAIIPFITFAQSPKTNSKKHPLIESITSDTSNGKFYQVLFSYDQNDRVIGITNKVIKITTVANKKTSKIIEEINQIFEYVGNSMEPYVRKTGYPAYNSATKNWHTDFIEEQYFLYDSGHRVGDSTLLLKEHKKILGKLEQTEKGIYHEIDLRPPYNPNKYENPNSYENDFYLESPSNISEETSRHFTGYKFVETTYYIFSTFDSMMNPLKQLNIASVLVNEKICFPFTGGKNIGEYAISFFRGGQYGEKGLNWYFFNQNNPLSYSVGNGETAPYKGIVNFLYTYNQFNQPIFAKANIKIVIRGNENYLIEKYQKRFTFRYKK
jgi:hypothetical protein